MFILKQKLSPTALVFAGAVLTAVLNLSLAAPKAGAVTIDELLVQVQALQAQIQQLQATQGGAAAIATSVATTAATTAAACAFTKSLYLGVSDPQVKCLQQYLNAAGYTVSVSGAGSPGKESAYFGAKTKVAVAKWQTTNGVLPTSGYFGAISRAKYVATGKAMSAPTTTTSPISPTTPIIPTTPTTTVATTATPLSITTTSYSFSHCGHGLFSDHIRCWRLRLVFVASFKRHFSSGVKFGAGFLRLFALSGSG